MNKFLLLIIMLVTVNHNSFAYEPISNLITPVSYFVNHVAQLTKLKENLNKYHQTSIVGTSGIGKTQFVRMFAYENKNNYNLIWFFDCNLDLNGEFLKLAKQLNKVNNANIPEDEEFVRKEVLNYLNFQKKWLLVFDNLKINDNEKIRDLVDGEHVGDIIFCSQNNEMLPYTISIPKFSRDETIALASLILENNNKKSIDFLAEAFKGYPILIVQGAQLLNRVKGLDEKEYIKKIQQSTDKIKVNINLAIQELRPTTIALLNKIVLINNQNFSKEFLNLIADDPKTVSEDIYQLSKFMLISNIDPREDNPTFETRIKDKERINYR